MIDLQRKRFSTLEQNNYKNRMDVECKSPSIAKKLLVV